MPRKRRRAKARPDDLLAWEMIFQSGRDYFDDAKDAGIEVDDYGRADDAVVAAAWQQFGAEYLKTWVDKHSEPWALRQFGPPVARGRRRR